MADHTGGPPAPPDVRFLDRGGEQPDNVRVTELDQELDDDETKH
jgi:hypothetical protein